MGNEDLYDGWEFDPALNRRRTLGGCLDGMLLAVVLLAALAACASLGFAPY